MSLSEFTSCEFFGTEHHREIDSVYSVHFVIATSTVNHMFWVWGHKKHISL